MLHQFLCTGQSHFGHTGNQTLRHASPLPCISHDADCLGTAFRCKWMRRDHDCILCLYSNQCLEHRRGGRIRRGSQCGDHTHRPRNIISVFLRITPNHADRWNIPDSFP